MGRQRGELLVGLLGDPSERHQGDDEAHGEQVGSWDYFAEVVTAGFHQTALRMVAEGVVDGSAIDCHVLAVEVARNPELADRLRVVSTLGPAPSQPVVVRAGLGRGLKADIRCRLLALRATLLEEHFVERFDPAPDYSSIAAAIGLPPQPLALRRQVSRKGG